MLFRSGENDGKVKEKLKEKWKKDLTLKQGVKLALDILKETQGKDFKNEGFELAIIETKKGKLKRFIGDELKEFVK